MKPLSDCWSGRYGRQKPIQGWSDRPRTKPNNPKETLAVWRHYVESMKQSNGKVDYKLVELGIFESYYFRSSDSSSHNDSDPIFLYFPQDEQ